MNIRFFGDNPVDEDSIVFGHFEPEYTEEFNVTVHTMIECLSKLPEVVQALWNKIPEEELDYIIGQVYIDIYMGTEILLETPEYKVYTQGEVWDDNFYNNSICIEFNNKYIISMSFRDSFRAKYLLSGSYGNDLRIKSNTGYELQIYSLDSDITFHNLGIVLAENSVEGMLLKLSEQLLDMNIILVHRNIQFEYNCNILHSVRMHTSSLTSEEKENIYLVDKNEKYHNLYNIYGTLAILVGTDNEALELKEINKDLKPLRVMMSKDELIVSMNDDKVPSFYIEINKET